MKKILYVYVFIFSFSISIQAKSWTALSSASPAKYKTVYKALPNGASEIVINIPGFYSQEVSTPLGIANSISISGGGKMLMAGEPDLPQFAVSLIIPDGATMKTEMIASTYKDFHVSVAPSKGNLKRNINPGDIPFTYSSSYSSEKFTPSEIVSLRTPYILRDFNGQAVVVRPMQYNPVTKTLRVYSSIKLKVYPADKLNSSNGRKTTKSVDPDFADIYRRHFINYSPATYTPRNEHGRMLVIADSSFFTAMQPFVDWKNKTGQPTEIISVSAAGSNPEEIKNYINDYYTTYGLTFVLLVGDGPQVPPYPSPYGDSDPSYGYILGSDSYAEVFVGRFSANTVSQLNTQVQRSIDYEKNPDPVGEWYHKGVCIGSDQGPGDDNEMDFEHERNIRTDFIGYNYTLVDELYDGFQGGVDAAGFPDATDLNTALNDGRSVVTYTGHGSTTSLGTTGYSNYDVAGLTNVNQLPFIWSVACVNGDFVNGTCLAESFMRSTNASGNPTGTIAAFMATINQSWDPPMDAQDEMVDVLVESYSANLKHSYGAISVSGCMHMNDVYGTDGDEMTDTWTTFGDPSLTLRTNTPFPLTVIHQASLDETLSSVSLSCPTENAQICISKNSQIISAGMIQNGAVILATTGIHLGDTLDVTGTAYNAIPYFGKMVVTASTTGINFPESGLISIYPSPTHGQIKINGNLKNVCIEVLNPLGQVEMKTGILHYANNSFSVDLSSLSRGVHSVVVYSDNQRAAVRKIVIE